MRRKFVLLTVLLVLGIVSSSFIEAQAVVLNVSTRWLTNSALTSRLVNPPGTLATFPNEAGTSAYEPMISDDEVIYVDADLNITTNTQFWAVQVDCTTTNTMLETYTFDPATATDNPGDNIAVFDPNGNVLGGIGANTTLIYQPSLTDKGKFSVTISRISMSEAAFGLRGITNTYTFGTIRLRVKPQIAGLINNTTFKGIPTLVCTSFFVDRNGASIGTATYTPPKALTIIAGYTINGTAKYQAQTTHAGITIFCKSPTESSTGQTDAAGNWKLSGFRVAGKYQCQAFPNKVNASPTPEPDAYLAVTQTFLVSNDDVQLLPIKLLTGDVQDRVTAYAGKVFNVPTYATFSISTMDLSAVTANYNTTVPGTPFRIGDANGDAKVDRSDLALTTGNLGLSTEWASGYGVLGDHVLVSGQPTASAILADNRILINDGSIVYSPFATTQLIAGTNRDFWATISPNGKQIAFSRSTGTGTAQRYQVFVAPIVSGVVGAPVRVSTGTLYDESAPSWSPDGLQLAYTCSPVAPARAIQSNSGSLCLSKNPGGAATAPSVFDTFVKIYPPAWANKEFLIYAGTTGNVSCQNTLCGYSLPTTSGFALSPTVLGSTSGAGTLSGREDMPVVRGDFIYYRYDDGNVTTPNAIHVTSSDTPTFNTLAVNQICSSASFHVAVTTGLIDYYTLKDNSFEVLTMPYTVVVPTTIQNLNYINKFQASGFCPDPAALTNSPIYNVYDAIDFRDLNTNVAYTLISPSDVYATRISLQLLP